MKTAMILAAGRGDRLKPRTLHSPKALCPVNQRPLIDYHLLALEEAGFTRVIINHAYLGGQIRAFVQAQKSLNMDIIFSPEPPGGLETGGGIYYALPLLGNSPFLVVSADIFTTINFKTIQPLASDQLAHLVLVDNPKHNQAGDFGLTQGKITLSREYTYGNIGYYSPELFKHQSMGRYRLAPLIRQYAQEGKISGEYCSALWMDIGTEARLKEANALF
jgi:MurNAc alpha-1-phosphate uridylyltransferase